MSQWMADNAFVCWQQDNAPWVRERELIEELPLPLNLDANKSNPYAATLSGLRHSAREGGVDGQGGHNNRRASTTTSTAAHWMAVPMP